MSGLQRFVGRDEAPQHASPPSTQLQQQFRHVQADRAAAAAEAKIGLKRSTRAMKASQPLGQMLPTTASASSYNSSPATLRNAYPNQISQQQDVPLPVQQFEEDSRYMAKNEQPPLAEGGVFDDTITSNLEDTNSDVQENGYNMRSGDLRLEDGRHDFYSKEGRLHNAHPDRHQHMPSKDPHSERSVLKSGLQGKRSISDLQRQEVLYAPQSIRTVGRFEAPVGDQWRPEIAHRDSQVVGQQVRTFSPGGNLNDSMCSGERDDAVGQGMVHREEDGYGSSSSLDSDLPTRGGDGRHTQQKSEEALKLRSIVLDAASSRPLGARDEVEQALCARLKDPNRGKLDYDDETLKSLKYAELQEESWDAPRFTKLNSQTYRAKRAKPTTENLSSEFSFNEMMGYMVQNETLEFQIQTFEDMSMEDFEKAGDFFTGKFQELMSEIREARKGKRELISRFEEEVEAREKVVRARSENLDRQLREMRAGGEGMLKGKV